MGRFERLFGKSESNEWRKILRLLIWELMVGKNFEAVGLGIGGGGSFCLVKWLLLPKLMKFIIFFD